MSDVAVAMSAMVPIAFISFAAGWLWRATHHRRAEVLDIEIDQRPNLAWPNRTTTILSLESASSAELARLATIVKVAREAEDPPIVRRYR